MGRQALGSQTEFTKSVTDARATAFPRLDWPGFHRSLPCGGLLGNVLLFAPLGLLLPLLGARFRRFGFTAAVGLSVSVGIELVQLAMRFMTVSPRSVDIDDVILNVLGASLGYLFWWATHAFAAPRAGTSEALEDSA